MRPKPGTQRGGQPRNSTRWILQNVASLKAILSPEVRFPIKIPPGCFFRDSCTRCCASTSRRGKQGGKKNREQAKIKIQTKQGRKPTKTHRLVRNPRHPFQNFFENPAQRRFGRPRCEPQPPSQIQCGRLVKRWCSTLPDMLSCMCCTIYSSAELPIGTSKSDEREGFDVSTSIGKKNLALHTYGSLRQCAPIHLRAQKN